MKRYFLTISQARGFQGVTDLRSSSILCGLHRAGLASRLWENIIPQADTENFKYLNNGRTRNLRLDPQNRNVSKPAHSIGFSTGSFRA